MAKLALNFGFRSSSQARNEGASVREIRSITDGFARVIVNDVAIAAAKENQKKLQSRLRDAVGKAVKADLQRMTIAMSRLFWPDYKNDGPVGNLRLAGTVLSDTARKTPGFSSDVAWNMNKSGIKWQRWSKRYQRTKKRNRNTWFKNSGQLDNWLSSRSVEYFEQAFGPVRVIFHGKPINDNTRVNVTRGASSGRNSSRVVLGNLEVLAFNRITPGMMPGLSTMTPTGSNPLPGPGVAKLLFQTYGQDKNIAKLLRRSTGANQTSRRMQSEFVGYTPVRKKKKFKYRLVTDVEKRTPMYRPALDPFVSYWLTRSIPNTIWGRVEKEIEANAGVVTSSAKRGN